MTPFRLVTLADVRRQVAYDGILSDAMLIFRLERISAAVFDFIGTHSENGLEGWADSSGPFVDDDGNPLALYLIVDSNGDAILDSDGHRQYNMDVAVFDSNGDYADGGVSVVPGHVQWAVIAALAPPDVDLAADPLSPAVKSLLQRTRQPVVV